MVGTGLVQVGQGIFASNNKKIYLMNRDPDNLKRKIAHQNVFRICSVGGEPLQLILPQIENACLNDHTNTNTKRGVALDISSLCQTCKIQTQIPTDTHAIATRYFG